MRVRSDARSRYNAGARCAPLLLAPAPLVFRLPQSSREIGLVARLEGDRLLQPLACYVECVAPRRSD
jgi:hypothetical protein